MELLKTFLLFVITAVAEIVGCYLPYLWLNQSRTAWLLVPAAVSLALFAWLLSLIQPRRGGSMQPMVVCILGLPSSG
jgi:drug/metabolite transporter superfamily protein YnfA